ncbi:hypothetical protein OPQ81_001181 [Rhizoctonia solani]|nr:hypothetical protein OPQ81_001181 [Rhizoctonia solani]
MRIWFRTFRDCGIVHETFTTSCSENLTKLVAPQYATEHTCILISHRRVTCWHNLVEPRHLHSLIRQLRRKVDFDLQSA